MQRGRRFCESGLILSIIMFCLTNSCTMCLSGQDMADHHPDYRVYHNKRFGFSFQYPGQWVLTESLTNNGAVIKPKSGPNLPAMSIVASKVQAEQDGHEQTLEQELESDLASMRTQRPHASHHISNVVVAKKELITFQGLPAIARTITYDLDGKGWIDQGIMFRVSDVSYTFEVSFSCHPADLSVFVGVYDKVLETFRFLGDGYESVPAVASPR